MYAGMQVFQCFPPDRGVRLSLVAQQVRNIRGLPGLTKGDCHDGIEWGRLTSTMTLLIKTTSATTPETHDSSLNLLDGEPAKPAPPALLVKSRRGLGGVGAIHSHRGGFIWIRCTLGVFEIENIASIDISINIGKLILKVDIEGR